MAGSLNKVLLIGNLGRDPELRQGQSGVSVVNLTIATNEKFKDSTGEWREKTEWHKVVAFGAKADTMAKYLKKGRPVFIEGSLQTREWEDKDKNKRYSTEIVVRDFQFLGGGERANSAVPEPSFANEPVDGSADFEPEDIPF